MIDIADLSPDERASLLSQLSAEARDRDATAQTEQEIDRALRNGLSARGVGVGSPWEDPSGQTSRAYPLRWLVQHDGRWWTSTVSVNLSRPSDQSRQWRVTDPDAPSAAPPQDGDDHASG